MLCVCVELRFTVCHRIPLTKICRTTVSVPKAQDVVDEKGDEASSNSSSLKDSDDVNPDFNLLTSHVQAALTSFSVTNCTPSAAPDSLKVTYQPLEKFNSKLPVENGHHMCVSCLIVYLRR